MLACCWIQSHWQHCDLEMSICRFYILGSFSQRFLVISRSFLVFLLVFSCWLWFLWFLGFVICLVQLRMSQRQFHCLKVVNMSKVKAWTSRIATSPLPLRCLLHFHNLILKTSDICVWLSWRLQNSEAELIPLMLRGATQIGSSQGTIWRGALGLVNLHHTHKRVHFVYQQTNHASVLLSTLDRWNKTLTTLLNLLWIYWICSRNTIQKRQVRDRHRNSDRDSHRDGNRDRHGDRHAKVAATVVKRVFFKTQLAKLLRFLWCMRIEEPGSSWSCSRKEMQETPLTGTMQHHATQCN